MSPIIHHTFGPLVTRNQYWQSWFLQWVPWRHSVGAATTILKQKLQDFFQKETYLFYNGRQALLATLQGMHLKPGDEIILQAYTCIVVPNAIIAAGAIPVYCDITRETLNINPDAIEKKITPRTKAIICQHTFGIPADIETIIKIARTHNILVIEDCAHSIPTDRTSEPIGQLGDIILLSFGRDKALSGITGGAIATNIPSLQTHLREAEKNALHVSKYHIQILLGYSIHYGFIKKIGSSLLLRIYLRILQKVRLLPIILSGLEKKGIMNTKLYAMPNACAELAIAQWQSLTVFNTHRRSISVFFQKHPLAHVSYIEGTKNATALQKFPIYCSHRNECIASLRKYGIFLQDGWSGSVVNPVDTIAKTVHYAKGSCPEAEYCSQHILSLPTHPTMSTMDSVYTLQKIRDFFSSIKRNATSA